MGKKAKTSKKHLASKGNNRLRLIRLIIICIVLLVFLVSLKNIFVLQSENSKLKKEQESLLSEKEVLKDELKNVNDKEYIEEQARIQLKMIKPGEIIYILQDEKGKEDKDNGKKDN